MNRSLVSPGIKTSVSISLFWLLCEISEGLDELLGEETVLTRRVSSKLLRVFLAKRSIT
jgi:predicted transcriptional regulator